MKKQKGMQYRPEDVAFKKKSEDFTLTEVKSDGGKNDFYRFAPYVKDIDSLARFLQLNGAEFNILKSLTCNIGQRHNGTDNVREVKKCLHYAVERMLWSGLNKEEILSQVKKQLEEK